MLLVLVEPLVSVVRHQLVPAEAGVHQAVDETGREVLARRVYVRAKRRPRVVQVRFVNVLRGFRLHNVQLWVETGGVQMKATDQRKARLEVSEMGQGSVRRVRG